MTTKLVWGLSTAKQIGCGHGKKKPNEVWVLAHWIPPPWYEHAHRFRSRTLPLPFNWTDKNRNVCNGVMLISVVLTALWWNAELFKCWNAEMLNYWNTEMLKFWSAKMLECWNAEIQHSKMMKGWIAVILKYWNANMLKC